MMTATILAKKTEVQELIQSCMLLNYLSLMLSCIAFISLLVLLIVLIMRLVGRNASGMPVVTPVVYGIAGIAGVLCVLSICLLAVKGRLEKQSYASLIELASSSYATDSADAIDNYKKAIQLVPEKPDAYEALRKSILVDGSFDSNEHTVIWEVLFGNNSLDSTSNASKLAKKAPKECYELCYNLGIMYFALTENNESTIKFLGIAADGEELENTKKTMAQSILSITQLLSQRQAGVAGSLSGNEDSKGYAEYWKDIETIANANLAVMSGDVPIIQVRTYVRLVQVIDNKKANFAMASVTKEQMLYIVEKARMEVEKIQATNSEATTGYSAEYFEKVLSDLNAM